jgi:putative SOS response-associated peptidase YedK
MIPDLASAAASRRDLAPSSKPFLAPYPSERMTCWPLGARVGNVKNNDPSLVAPITVG